MIQETYGGGHTQPEKKKNKLEVAITEERKAMRA
jgi:hypothetical protein